MYRQSRPPIIALLLGVLIALGLSLMTVQATAMAATMLSSSDIGHMSAPAGCNQCGGGVDGMMAGHCVSACAVPVAIAPALLPPIAIAAKTGVVAQDEPLPPGTAFAPRLRPPRLAAVG